MRSSQNHKRDVQGVSSDFRYKGLAKSLTQHGTDTVPAKVELSGLWPTDSVITVTVNAGAGNLSDDYTVTGDPTETPAEVATGLATALAALADVDATATGSVVNITKATAGNIRVVSVVVS